MFKHLMRALAVIATIAAIGAASASAVGVMPLLVGPGRTVIFDHTGWSCDYKYDQQNRNIVCHHRSNRLAVVLGPGNDATVVGGDVHPVAKP